MSFHDTKLPLRYSYDSQHGVGFDTLIYIADSGYPTTIPRRRDLMIFNPSYNVKSVEDIALLRHFFMCRYGSSFSFRFEDLSDSTSATDGKSPPTMLDQVVYYDAVLDKYFLAKTYDGYSRLITKPQDSTVLFSYNGVATFTPSVNLLTGEVTAYTPVSPALFKCGFRFDVPVRFADGFMPTYVGYRNGDIPLELHEVLE